MKTDRPKLGRPPGKEYPQRLVGYVSDTQARAFFRWRQAMGYSESEAIRRLVTQGIERQESSE